ncbi:MAG TPA: OmpA family protein [Polyangia bacterium]|nr:OmpA family protein [Polyangia bacterium]
MTSRSWSTVVALALGVGAFGCSHEQKAPPAHPAAAAPVAAVRRAAPRAQPPVEIATNQAPKRKEEPSIYFDFDSALLRPESHDVLQKVAATLRNRDTGALRIEGNCDELGTTEYNLALGEERARAAQAYLLHLGVPRGRLQTVSYGSEHPKYPGHDDDAHAKNRRDDLIVR